MPYRTSGLGPRNSPLFGIRRSWVMIRAADPLAIEAFVAGQTMIWGLWLLNPWAQTFRSAPGYRAMSVLAPEWFWGLVMVAVASVALHGLVTVNNRLRRIAMGVTAVLWAFVAVTIVVSNPSGTGWIPYGGFMVGGAWSFLRLPVTGRSRV